jgi:hypothetical protein
MNPRPSSQPVDYHSRRTSSAMWFSPGRIIARDVHLIAKQAPTLRR